MALKDLEVSSFYRVEVRETYSETKNADPGWISPVSLSCFTGGEGFHQFQYLTASEFLISTNRPAILNILILTEASDVVASIYEQHCS